MAHAYVLVRGARFNRYGVQCEINVTVEIFVFMCKSVCLLSNVITVDRIEKKNEGIEVI